MVLISRIKSCFLLKRRCLFYQSICDIHIPVMVKEVLAYLAPSKDNLVIDATFGSGGHTRALMNVEPSLKIICLDRDPFAYSKAVQLSKEFPDQIFPCLGRFSELPQILKQLNIEKGSVDCMLFDLGCSSDQLDDAKRGFSISKNGPLDMRMDGNRNNCPRALDVLKKADEEDLVKIFKIYGEEKLAKEIAREIVESRYSFGELNSTWDLAQLVSKACNTDRRVDKLQRPSHIATKIFQALRIFVNNELNEINYAMYIADWYMKVNGRLVTLAFHSLEDRIIKRHLMGTVEYASGQVPLHYSSHAEVHDEKIMENIRKTNWLLTTKHVVVPSEGEVARNPRSRSAKLRGAIKIK